MGKKKPLPEFDKYYYYHKSVQSPDDDAEFYEKAYGHFFPDYEAITLREDFCAAFANSCSWVKLSSEKQAIGLDIDIEPISYGKKNYLSKLSADEQKRINIMEKNVLDKDAPSADIITATNFSYFCFKKRNDLLEYFKNCHNTLNEEGVLILDCFGGPECHEANEHETEHDTFSYYWDQDNFNPITHEATFYIHFKRKGEAKRNKEFIYDWRLWSIPEIKDLLEEAGFSESVVYWEGSDDSGDGNGEFDITETGEECESWIAYIVGKK